MTLAVILAIVASLLWGITNHIDKYMISGIEENNDSVKVLLLFSTFVAGIVLTPLWLILGKFNIAISVTSLISVLVGVFMYIFATWLYYKAIEKNDASLVVVMFQLIPVFSYLIALILFKETLSIRQIIGSIIIIMSAVIISIDFEENNKKSKLQALILMILSSLFYAIYFILFDVGIRHASYYSCAFWFQIGFLLLGLILLSIKSYRNAFFGAIKRNGKKYLIFNTTNEIINLVANLLVNYANVFIPIALVNVLNGFQGTFVFIIGLIGTLLFPKYIKEDLRKGVIIQKVICIIIGIIGLIILVGD